MNTNYFNSQFDQIVHPIEENPLLMAIFQTALVVVAVLSAPKLPPQAKSVLQMWPTKIAVLAVCVYLSNKKPALALLAGILFFVILQYSGTLESKTSSVQ